MTKSSHLIDYLDFINRGPSFYYVNDIKYTLNYYNINNKGKKTELMTRLHTFYNKLKNYKKYENQIINRYPANLTHV